MTIDAKQLIYGVRFPDIDPNFHDINSMKFDLNVSVKVRFIAIDPGPLA